jgi:flavin reductase (DIM6/NTAB) family NADH-FMN oxidoreductase RutF
MVIDPAAEQPANVYKLLTGLLIPRPIAFVSTLDAAGGRNLAPFSFFTAVSANPPVICFAPLVRSTTGKTKDTLHNIEATREFVVNVVTESIATQMNAASAEVGPDVDEFVLSGLTPVPSDLVRPPRVAESPVNLECSLLQVVRVSDRPLGGSLVLGTILRFHVHDRLVRDFKIDPELLRAIGRMGGPTYVRLSDRFDMERPTLPK